MNEVVIYSGRQCLGYIIERNAKRCEAYDANGRDLGVFVSRVKATSAVCEAAREQQREAAA